MHPFYRPISGEPVENSRQGSDTGKRTQPGTVGTPRSTTCAGYVPFSTTDSDCKRYLQARCGATRRAGAAQFSGYGNHVPGIAGADCEDDRIREERAAEQV